MILMKKIGVVLLMFLFCNLGGNKVALLSKKQTSYKHVKADILNNLYLFSNSKIEKHTNSNEVYVYDNSSFGEFNSIDISDPLRIVLFNYDYQQIAYLDKTMTLKGSIISLTDAGLGDIRLVCAASNNGLWLYNADNFELIRINKQLQVTHRTEKLFSYVKNDINPILMIEYGNKLYFADKNNGVLMFSINGAFIDQFSGIISDCMQWIDNKIYYSNSENWLKSYNFETKALDSVFIKNFNNKAFDLNRKNLYSIKNDSIFHYFF